MSHLVEKKSSPATVSLAWSVSLLVSPHVPVRTTIISPTRACVVQAEPYWVQPIFCSLSPPAPPRVASSPTPSTLLPTSVFSRSLLCPPARPFSLILLRRSLSPSSSRASSLGDYGFRTDGISPTRCSGRKRWRVSRSRCGEGRTSDSSGIGT